MANIDSVEYLNNDTLIVSNPGTGKTTAIAQRVVDLLKAGAKEEEILCITFTEKAADEMRNKVASAISDTPELSEKRPAKIGIYTFHGYANSYLEEVGMNRELLGNNALRYSIYKSFRESNAFNYSDDYVISDIVPKSENAIRYLKSFGILPDSIDLEAANKELEQIYVQEGIENVSLEETKRFMGYFIDAFKAYENEKNKELNSMDYNDMLIEFLTNYDKAKRHYPYVLVDELQDVNELEREIALRSGESHFLVGDRKQSIFGFQGGSSKGFKAFKDGNVHVETKKLNYRSLQGILDYAKGLFLANTSDESYKEELEGLTAKREGKADVKIIITKEQGTAALDKLRELLDEDHNATYAIITRTNGQIISLSKMLESAGIEHSTTVGGHTNSMAKSEILAYLRGMLYNDPESVVLALFTPFSGVTLKEAFSIAEDAKYQSNALEIILSRAKEFAKIRGSLSMENLPPLFNEIILPVSVSMGREYYLAANLVYKSINEFFENTKAPDRKALFDYLAITEEEYESLKKPSQVTLTTVHKAKGLEFDRVIYVPVETRGSLSFIDAVIYSIIKSKKGIDVREELDEEDLRVDFVATTRARNSLYVVIKEKQRERYALDGVPVVNYEAEAAKEPVSWNYDEAYSLFVAGKRDESARLLEKDRNWLLDVVSDYFSSKDKLSYSLLADIDDPYEFLKKYILGIEGPRTKGLNTGTDVHRLAENRFKASFDESKVPENLKPYMANVISIDNAIRKKFDAVQIDAEYLIEVPLNAMFKGVNEKGMIFKGKLDAVYKSNSGKSYIILDWKTDKKNEKASEHRRQLAVYRKAYSIDKGISEDSINVALGFVGLRGNINTGKVGLELDAAQPRKGQFETVEKRVIKFMEYRQNPWAFLNDVANMGSDEPLYSRISALIARNK